MSPRPAESECRRQFAAKLLAYQADPIGFQLHVLNVKTWSIWSKMVEVAESVRDYQRTAVPAGHGVSKTFEAGRLVVWFKSCFVPSTVITTAPSDNQVRNQLWREIHAAVVGSKVPLGPAPTALMWDVRPSPATLAKLPPSDREAWEKNFAVGFATSPDTVGEHCTKMHGWHNKHVLIVLDEACGIARQIWSTIMESLLINERCKILAIGNPTDPLSDFAEVCEAPDAQTDISKPYMSKRGWHVVPISVKDTPNYIEGREVIPGVAGRDYEQLVATKHPPGSNGYLIRVEGRFPSYREGTYYGKEYATAEAAGRIGDYAWDPAFLVYRFADLGDMYTAAVDVQFIRGRIRIIGDYWDNQGLGAVAFAQSMQCKPWVWGKEHFAGPDLAGSNAKSFQTGKTTKDVLAGLGVNVAPVIRHAFDDGIQAVRLVWPLLDVSKQGAPTFLKAAQNYGKKKNEAASTDDQPVYYNSPAESWERHMMDALRHLAMAYKYMRIGGQYVGDSRLVAAYHSQPKPAAGKVDWLRRERFARRS